MKKITLLSMILSAYMGTTMPAYANKNLWQPFVGKVAPSANPKPNLPSQYEIVKLDQEAIKLLLGQAGSTFATGVNIDIPTPGGGFKTFRVWNTPVMEDELQARFPEIQTYTGSLLKDPNQTVKISTGPMGVFIRTYSFDMEDVFAIEPYGFDANGYYTLAKAAHFYRLPFAGTCNPESLGSPVIDAEAMQINNRGTAARTMGEIRRTYRLALACTGEYAAAVSGTPNPTVAQILAIMTATVNNANGIWERELSISTVLVNNNTAIIYIDPNSDPYANDGNHDEVIGENQANHDIFIGNNNYDLGHVFTASGGGLAQLASVCVSGGKASGVSGSSGPTDVGTFTHEVGHQLGAGHTFTSEQGGCNGNGMEGSAIEPGSGTTIMSYNGACGADNTPIFTTPMTDYYNQHNLKQMRAVITTSGACGTTVLGQTPVQLPNMDRRYIIPANTPFELVADEATNTVATNGAPLYNWEQNDIGPINMVEANGASATSGPVFMSMPPTTDRVRVFPRYAQLADGQYSASGERLPTVQRLMHYKVTARSIAQDGWGTHNTIEGDIVIKTVPGQSPFRVQGVNDVPPTGMEPGQQYPVVWNVANTLEPADSIMTGTVNIYMSLDGGMSFPIILATNVPNTGSYNITAPNYATSSARVKVKGVGNIFFDVSQTDLKINGTVGVKGVNIDNDITVFPNPATNVINIKNEAFNGEPMNVRILNFLGQEVWTGSMHAEQSIDVANFAKGAYFLYFRSENSGKFGVKKVIIQ